MIKTSRLVVDKVRREKALDFSGCNSRPGTGSFHPVAIETAAEATKLSELSMERVARRLRERAGHNGRERGARVRLLIPQSHHGLDQRRPSCRQVACDCCDGQ